MTHPRLIETMRKPDFCPHHPAEVELIQTHISYVFITGNIVYKVKNHFKFDFLDFTRLEKRVLENDNASGGRGELFRKQKDDFDTIAEVPADCHIKIDTSASPEIKRQEIIRKIKLE